MRNIILSGSGIILAGIISHAYAGELPVPGPYLGLGGSWNTIDETYHSRMFTSSIQSGNDAYSANNLRLSPMIQIGYWAPFKCDWLWGVSAQWNYIGYKTTNVGTSRGQILPNATFSSINIFGPEVIRDFSSQTRINSELLLLAYAGMQTRNGYVYLGIGPAVLSVANSIYVSSIHTPAGTGDILTSGSVTGKENVWGGALQVGYSYYLDPTIFLNLNYTYITTGKYHFNNSINAAILNGFTVPGPNELNLNRSINFRVQQFMFSINKVFC